MKNLIIDCVKFKMYDEALILLEVYEKFLVKIADYIFNNKNKTIEELKKGVDEISKTEKIYSSIIPDTYKDKIYKNKDAIENANSIEDVINIIHPVSFPSQMVKNYYGK